MTYSFPPWVPLCAWAAAAAALLLALFLRRHKGALLFGLFVAAFTGGLIAPALALDRVVLDDDKLEQTTGFWWSPTVKGFRFAEVSSVRITKAYGRKKRPYEAWIVTLKDGGTRQIDPGDLWDRNRVDIVARLRAKGVDVRQDFAD